MAKFRNEISVTHQILLGYEIGDNDMGESRGDEKCIHNFSQKTQRAETASETYV
jgi:hypothetical protein